MAVKVFPDISFFKNTEFIFILHTLAKLAALAALLCPQRFDQGYDRVGQLPAFLSKNLNPYDDQDHANAICNWPAKGRRNQELAILL